MKIINKILTAELIILLLFCISVKTNIIFAETTPDDIKDALFYSDFEDEADISKWLSFGESVNIEADSSFSHSGKYSLKAYNRELSYDGPSIDLTPMVKPGGIYSVSMWVSYKGKENDNLKLTLRSTYSSKEEQFNQITTETGAEASRWINFTADFGIPLGAESVLLYLESDFSENELWIDDVIIKNNGLEKCTDILKPSGTSVFNFDHMYNEIKPKGNSVITRSNTISSDDEYSLMVTERSEFSDGISIDLSNLTPEKPYRFSMSVTFLDKNFDKEFFSAYLEYYTGDTFCSIPVTEDNEVVRLTWAALRSNITIPADAKDPCLTLSTVPSPGNNGNCVSFYVDAITFSDNLNPPGTISAKNIIIIISAAVFIIISAVIFLVIRHRTASRKILLASTDSMTGALNRNAYEEKIIYYEKHPSKCKKLHIAVCDVNGLKEINDTWGHKAGDECIIRCARTLLTTLSEIKGEVYRTGGDEFICISKKPFRDALLKAVLDEEMKYSRYHFSVASGFSEYDKSTDGARPGIKPIISRCDKEMYKNKAEKKSKEKK